MSKMTKTEECLRLLDRLSVFAVEYQDWVKVGMVLAAYGCSLSDWENWSRGDLGKFSKDPNCCKRRWNTFSSTPTGGVSIGTLAKLVEDNGGSAFVGEASSGDYHECLEDDGEDFDMHGNIPTIGGNAKKFIVDGFKGDRKVPAIDLTKDPNDDLKAYLTELFAPNEHVCFVQDTAKGTDGRPGYGKSFLVKNIIDDLSKPENIRCHSGVNAELGSWMTSNPVDGSGRKKSNITQYRYSLIECDTMTHQEQYNFLLDLRLPIATLVHSGKRSLHALVRIDATTQREYSERVAFLGKECARQGFEIDDNTKDASRLTRPPGFMRGSIETEDEDGNKIQSPRFQYLIGTNLGCKDWDSWIEEVRKLDDDLPEFEDLDKDWDDEVILDPELIHGVLRQGQKMIISAQSKAGKTWQLIQLSLAIANGGKWNDWQCEQGKVLYINLELNAKSCKKRFKDCAKKMGYNSGKNITVWNLRGKNTTMRKLAPILINRAQKAGYIAVIIDPIYKVMEGDENNAAEVAKFCNMFDKICTDMKTAAIYCHHHSKGSQGAKKSSDRSSGSGVFSRDPDAIMDIIPLDIDPQIETAIIEEKQAEAMQTLFLDKYFPKEHVSDASEGFVTFRTECQRLAGETHSGELSKIIYEAGVAAEAISCWRIEGTLREFAGFKPRNIFFEYPIHRVDEHGMLENAVAEGEEPPKQYKTKEKKDKPKQASVKETRMNELEMAFSMSDTISLEDAAECTELSETQIKTIIKSSGGAFKLTDGNITKREG